MKTDLLLLQQIAKDIEISYPQQPEFVPLPIMYLRHFLETLYVILAIANELSQTYSYFESLLPVYPLLGLENSQVSNWRIPHTYFLLILLTLQAHFQKIYYFDLK